MKVYILNDGANSLFILQFINIISPCGGIIYNIFSLSKSLVLTPGQKLYPANPILPLLYELLHYNYIVVMNNLLNQ